MIFVDREAFEKDKVEPGETFSFKLWPSQLPSIQGKVELSFNGMVGGLRALEIQEANINGLFEDPGQYQVNIVLNNSDITNQSFIAEFNDTGLIL